MQEKPTYNSLLTDLRMVAALLMPLAMAGAAIAAWREAH